MKTRFLTLCCALLGFGAMAMADEVTFTYTVEGNNATITGVSGAVSDALVIPSAVGEGSDGTYTVVAIGDAALHNGSYTSVTIPNTVTSIGNDAFANCTSLQTVTFGEDQGGGSGDTGGDEPKTTSLRLKSGGETSSLLTIGSSAFNGDIALGSITIPASVTTIGNDAFAGCTSLASVTFEDNSACTSIGESAFNSCSSLTEFTFPDGVIVVANDILAGCTSLTTVTFSESTTEIGGSAFASCEKLTEVTLPSTLTTIGDYAFGESGLTSIEIPALVTSIGDMAFAYLTFSEDGVTNNSSVVLTSNMFYKSNVETDYMEWDEIPTETIVSCSAPILIKWEDLEDYRYIKFEITYDEDSEGSGWAPGAIYYTTGSTNWEDDKLYDLPTYEQGYTASEVIYKISDLKAAVEEAYASASTPDLTSIKPYADDEEAQGTVGFYVAAWSPATAVTLLAGPKIETVDEDEGDTSDDFILPIVDLFYAESVGDWGSNTTAAVDQTGEALVLTFVKGWGSYVFTNWYPCWDLSAYDTAILTYSFDDEFVTSGNYAQLIVEDNTTAYNTVSNSDNNMDRGVVTVDLTSNAALDLTCISQIAVQTLAEATITVEEIRFTYTGASTAIASVASDIEATEVARYNLMGQKISGAEKGINIIVYSDGSAKKVLVK